MSAIIDSRQQVLSNIRAATRNSAATAEDAAGAYSAIERAYVRRGSMSAEARLERMAERLREYDAEVVECEPEGLVAAVAAQLAASGRHRFVVPAGLPAEWLIPGFEWKIDKELPVQEVEQAEGVVTACFCGVAESGTIVLHHSETEGRRVISLLPDWHLCVVLASQVVETLPEYFEKAGDRKAGNKPPHRAEIARWGPREETREQETGNEVTRLQGYEGTRGQGNKEEKDLPALVTWISGPSATADIEMTRIKGVHGPRFLRVILVRD
jgi:L-lactate dehydrogenase complex protein LldG